MTARQRGESWLPWAIVVLGLVLIMVLTYLALLNYGAPSTELAGYRRSLEAGDYEEAGRQFAAEARGNPALEREARALVIQAIERLKARYANGELDEAEVEAQLLRMQQAAVLRDSGLIELASADLDVLRRSHAAFGEAERDAQASDLAAAIRGYEQVRLLDPRYETAQIRLSELRGRYLNEETRAIRHAIANDQLDLAQRRLDASIALVPGQAVLAQLRNELEMARTRLRHQAILEACLVDVGRGDYGAALKRLHEAQQREPDEALLLSEYMRYMKLAESSVLERAEAAYGRGDRAAALRELDRGLELLPERPLLVTWRHWYAAQAGEAGD